MKIGQQVHLIFDPDKTKGTVSAIEPGRVRVTWPRPHRGAPRLKAWYDNTTFLKAFTTGYVQK